MGLASRGLRDWDHGAEVIPDREELATVRRQARGVLMRGTGVSVLLMLLALALP
ncbi:MAG TPA: hypothetical protein VK849_10265 [Longimicrobiales bacterium]|nr:hypothetical protein [Longimicrobiales bacterium]